MRRPAKDGRCTGPGLVLAAALAGCAAPGMPVAPVDTPASLPQAPGAQLPAVFTVGGGVPLRRVPSLRDAQAGDLPPVQSAQEYQALAELATELLTRAKQARDRKDIEAFWANYYAGQKLAVHLLAISSASDTVLRNMQDDGGGKIVSVIPAGGQVLLPTSRAIGELPVSLPPADLDASPAARPLTINNLLGIGSKPALPSQAGMTVNGMPALRELPDGVPVALPNGVTALRSGDALVLSNPTDKQQALPLSDMGYTLPSAPAAGPDWARIALAMSWNKSAHLWAKIPRMGGKSFHCDIAPPGVLNCSDGERKWFAQDGGWAQTPAQSQETAKVYAAKGSPFRRAVDQAVRGMAVFEPFHQRCLSVRSAGQYYVDNDELSGERANFVSYGCWRSDGATGPFRLVHSQQYQLMENGATPQTEASLLKDKQVRERLMKWQREKQLVQAIAALVPGLGNAEALARCTTRNPDFAPTALLADYMAHRAGNQASRDMQAAALVGYRAPASSLAGNIMDCSAVLIPVISGVKGGASATGAAKGWLDAWPKASEAINRARASTIDRLRASDATLVQGAKLLGLDGMKLSFKIGVALGHFNWYAGEAMANRHPPGATPYATALQALK